MTDEAGAVPTKESPCVLMKYTEMQGSDSNLPLNRPTFLKSTSSPGKMVKQKSQINFL